MKDLDQLVTKLRAADHQNDNVRGRGEELQDAAEEIRKNVVTRLSVAVVRFHAKEEAVTGEEVDDIRLQRTHQTQKNLHENQRQRTEFGTRMAVLADRWPIGDVIEADERRNHADARGDECANDEANGVAILRREATIVEKLEPALEAFSLQRNGAIGVRTDEMIGLSTELMLVEVVDARAGLK